MYTDNKVMDLVYVLITLRTNGTNQNKKRMKIDGR